MHQNGGMSAADAYNTAVNNVRATLLARTSAYSARLAGRTTSRSQDARRVDVEVKEEPQSPSPPPTPSSSASSPALPPSLKRRRSSSAVEGAGSTSVGRSHELLIPAPPAPEARRGSGLDAVEDPKEDRPSWRRPRRGFIDLTGDDDDDDEDDKEDDDDKEVAGVVVADLSSWWEYGARLFPVLEQVPTLLVVTRDRDGNVLQQPFCAWADGVLPVPLAHLAVAFVVSLFVALLTS